MRTLGRNLLTLLLIALMAIPAVSPPVLQHSHADGNTSHRHGAVIVAGHGHSHAHGAKHSHSSRHVHRSGTTAKHTHNNSAVRSAAFPVTHAHLFWFGIEWSVPGSDRSDSGRWDSSVEQWVPLVSEIVLPEARQDGSSVVATDRAMPTGLEPLLTVRSVDRSLNERAMTWLCDIARRERSVVFVI